MVVRTLMALALASAVLTAVAAEPQMEQERELIRTYCKSDVERLCKGVEPGGGRIKDCLKTHENEMSVGCAKALQELKKSKG
jgi:hypothetical protein